MIFICHYWSEMHFYLRDKCFIDKGLERKFLLPLLVEDVSVTQGMGATIRKIISSHAPKDGAWNNEEGLDRKSLLGTH